MRTIQYSHHERLVWVQSDLKGKHWDYCLCGICSRLNKGCATANMPLLHLSGNAQILSPKIQIKNDFK
jgi:hypothetical protein